MKSTKKIFRFFLSFLIGCAFLGFSSSAFSLEEEIADKYPAATLAPIEQDKDLLKEKSTDEKFNLYVSGYALFGYDNNADYNPKRHKDGFFQNLTTVDVKYKHTDDMTFWAGVEVFDTIYFKYNDNTLFNVTPYVGFDWAFHENFEWRNWIYFDYYTYPNSHENTFVDVEFNSYLRHYINRDFYHELGYFHFNRWYPDRKRFLANATTGDDERADSRDGVKHRAKLFLFDNRLILKLSNEIYWNNSNDKFQNFNDYWVIRSRPSIMYFFTKKIFADASLIYRYRKYRDRRNTEDKTEKVHENTLTYNLSLYYNINDYLTLGASYSYTENYPNDPFYKYSGSIVSGGVYFSF